MNLPRQIFVTGTNTDIGKTVISAILVAGLKAYYWKPIQTGLREYSDTEWIKQHTRLPNSHFLPETYRLQEPLSPHTAAELEEVEINLDAFSLPAVPADKSLIIEGAGGLLVPINQRFFMVDLIKLLKVPVIVVCDSELGTINHTLLSLRILEQYAIPVFGVVMNGPKNQSNKRSIEHFGKVTVLAEIETFEEITPTSLMASFNQNFK